MRNLRFELRLADSGPAVLVLRGSGGSGSDDAGVVGRVFRLLKDQDEDHEDGDLDQDEDEGDADDADEDDDADL